MYNSLEFDLARDALGYLVKKFKIDRIYIPYYLCDVIRHTLYTLNCKPFFYHIDDNFLPVNKFLPEDYILYPNYFGICHYNVKKLVESYPRMIIDNAHSYYDSPHGFACFNAGHKFGFKKSILWFKDEICNNCIMPSKQNFQTYHESFVELHEKYKKQNLLKIDNIDKVCSFVYPLLVDTVQNADEIVKQLTMDGKIIYRYWNSLPKNFNEYKFYSRLIPIPVEF